MGWENLIYSSLPFEHGVTVPCPVAAAQSLALALSTDSGSWWKERRTKLKVQRVGTFSGLVLGKTLNLSQTVSSQETGATT